MFSTNFGSLKPRDKFNQSVMSVNDSTLVFNLGAWTVYTILLSVEGGRLEPAER